MPAKEKEETKATESVGPVASSSHIAEKKPDAVSLVSPAEKGALEDEVWLFVMWGPLCLMNIVQKSESEMSVLIDDETSKASKRKEGKDKVLSFLL